MLKVVPGSCHRRGGVRMVGVEAVESKQKTRTDVFHGKTDSGWEINELDMRGF